MGLKLSLAANLLLCRGGEIWGDSFKKGKKSENLKHLLYWKQFVNFSVQWIQNFWVIITSSSAWLWWRISWNAAFIVSDEYNRAFNSTVQSWHPPYGWRHPNSPAFVWPKWLREGRNPRLGRALALKDTVQGALWKGLCIRPEHLFTS